MGRLVRMNGELQHRITEVIERFVRENAAQRGLMDVTLQPSTDVFGLGLVDSLGLTELVLHVEEAFAVEIDFSAIDADSLTSMAGLASQLAQASVPAAA